MNNTNRPQTTETKAAPKGIAEWEPLEKPKSKYLTYIPLAIYAAFILTLLFFPDWVLYYIYYGPLHTLFPDSLYLPLYLDICLYLLFGIAILMLVPVIMSNPRKKLTIFWAILVCVIAMVSILGANWDGYKDVALVAQDKYLTTECNINTIRKYHPRRRSRRGGLRVNYHYVISSVEDMTGKKRTIHMNVYQYRELLKVQKEDGDRILHVYYLPNTERMLKYE